MYYTRCQVTVTRQKLNQESVKKQTDLVETGFTACTDDYVEKMTLMKQKKENEELHFGIIPCPLYYPPPSTCDYYFSYYSVNWNNKKFARMLVKADKKLERV